jgi:hypothetical protein
MNLPTILADVTTPTITPDTLTYIGWSGIITVMILREVFAYLIKNKSGDNGVRSSLPRDNKNDLKELADKVQYKDNCKQIVERIEDAFRNIESRDRERKEYQNSQFKKIDDQLVEVKTLIRNGNK